MAIKTKKKLQCFFCGRDDVSWKDSATLVKFVAASRKIKPHEKTGLCAKHQRAVANAIKRARFMALLPYTPRQ